MSRTLKVTGNHDMYDRDARFVRVIMSSLLALCCLPSVKKQKHDFQVCFLQLDLLIAIYNLNQLLFNFSHIVECLKFLVNQIMCDTDLYIFTCLEIN